MNFYKKLNIPVQVLREPFDTAKHSVKRFEHFDVNNFSTEYLEWIRGLGLQLVHAEIFYSVANTPYVIHQDHFKRTDFPKINFVFGGKNSKMNWYRVKPEKLGNIPEPNIHNPYMTFTQDQVDLVYSQELEGSCLVQAGVPHNVTLDTESRWCISTVYLLDNKRLLTWAEANKLFEPFIFND